MMTNKNSNIFVFPSLYFIYLDMEASTGRSVNNLQNFRSEPVNHEENKIANDSDVRNPNAIISPVYISVLVVGIILLIIIGVVAICVLRRQQTFYTRQWSIDRGGYVKGQCALPDLTAVDVRRDRATPPPYCEHQSPNCLYNGIKTLTT